MTKITQNLSLLLSLAIACGLVRTAHATLLVQYTFDESNSGNGTALNTNGSLGASADGNFSGAATRTSNTPAGVSLGALNLNPNGAGPFEGVGPSSHLTGLDPLSTLTVSTWVDVQGTRNVVGNNSYRSLVSDINPGSGNGWLFSYNVSGGNDAQMQLALQINHGPGHDVATPTVVNASNTWVFVAATWNQSTGDLKFYTGTPTSAVTQVGSTLSQSFTMASSGVPLQVGNDNADSTPNAFMDDVRVYDNVLSLAQLDAVRLQEITPVPEPSSVLLLVCGAAGLLWTARRKGFGKQIIAVAAATVR